MMRFVITLVISMAVIGNACAQVIKCVDPTTKQVSYTDSACPSASDATLIESRHSDQYYANEELKAKDAKIRINQSQQREQEATRLMSGSAPQEANKSAASPDNSNSYECSIAKQALGVAQTNAKPNLDTIALKRQEAEVACLGKDAHLQLEQAREIRKQNDFKTAVQAAPITVFLTSCDKSGCWCSDGNRYNVQGTAYISPNGRTCQKVGNAMQCE
jgi:hypothetical protein